MSVLFPPLAPGPLAAPHSGIREVAGEALGIPGAVRLDLGQPDFATPAHIVAAAKRAMDEGWTGYTETRGLRSLRELLAAKLAAVNGYRVDPEQIATGAGGVSVIAAAFASVLGPGDEVLLPDPGWPNYRLMVAWTSATAVRYPCPADLGHLPDLEALAALVTPRTRLLVLNSPNNPTGAIYPREVVERMAELAERHNLWLLSDECYDQIVFDARPTSPAALLPEGPDGRVISAYSFSKTYAMTGWRLGYLTGPARLIDSAVKVLESHCSCAPSISQKAGEAALQGPQDEVEAMVAAYRARRDLVVELLAQAELLVSEPTGAFYIMADVAPAGLGSREFAFRLLREQGVSVVPGEAFGQLSAGEVRISLASSEDDLRRGTTRLCGLVHELAGSSWRRNHAG
jgi:aspartate aminotransferase